MEEVKETKSPKKTKKAPYVREIPVMTRSRTRAQKKRMEDPACANLTKSPGKSILKKYSAFNNPHNLPKVPKKSRPVKSCLKKVSSCVDDNTIGVIPLKSVEIEKDVRFCTLVEVFSEEADMMEATRLFSTPGKGKSTQRRSAYSIRTRSMGLSEETAV